MMYERPPPMYTIRPPPVLGNILAVVMVCITIMLAFGFLYNVIYNPGSMRSAPVQFSVFGPSRPFYY